MNLNQLARELGLADADALQEAVLRWFGNAPTDFDNAVIQKCKDAAWCRRASEWLLAKCENDPIGRGTFANLCLLATLLDLAHPLNKADIVAVTKRMLQRCEEPASDEKARDAAIHGLLWLLHAVRDTEAVELLTAVAKENAANRYGAVAAECLSSIKWN